MKRLFLALGAAFTAAAAVAQDFPSQTIRIIIPYAPGGGTDILARPVAKSMEEAFKQPVIIDHKPGAGGNIGAEMTARSAPNGYTLVMANNSHTINPFVYSKPGYDMERDFAPVAVVGTSPTILVVHKAVPVSTLRELVDYAKSRPGKLNFSSAGVGTPGHLAGLLFNRQSGIDVAHIAYKGTGPAVMALLQKEVDIHFATPAAVAAHIKSGDFKALGVTSKSRFSAFPDVPAIAESGVAGLRDYEVDVWWGLLAPAGTPAEVLDKLNAGVRNALNDPALRENWLSRGMVPAGSTRSEFQSLIRADLQKWSRVVRDNRITVE